MTDDTDRLRELGRELPALDLDPDAATRIARAARRGPPKRRFIEPIIIAMFAASFLAWALYKVCEAFR